MPVDRSYIQPFAQRDSGAFLALTALANHADALEAAVGVRVGATGSVARPPAPPAASWTITASQGHYVIEISAPDAATSPVQHQLRSATSELFDANSATSTYTLGLGEGTRDIVDPNFAKFWQIRSRYQGSAWNSWRSYTTAAGVAALNAGALRTS